MKNTNYGLEGNNYVQTFPNKPMDVTGQQVNQPIQQYQWKNQQPMFSKQCQTVNKQNKYEIFENKHTLKFKI